MFIKYVFREQVIICAEQYSVNPMKAVRNLIFRKYLFRIINLGLGTGNVDGVCVKIEEIKVLGNLLLRKTADLKLKLNVTVVVLQLLKNEYYEGVVKEFTAEGIVIGFVNGLLEGTIHIDHLHKDTVYNQEKNQWILITQSSKRGYEWKTHQLVRFKIHSTQLEHSQPLSAQTHKGSTRNLIFLRADEPGLGPADWWV